MLPHLSDRVGQVLKYTIQEAAAPNPNCCKKDFWQNPENSRKQAPKDRTCDARRQPMQYLNRFYNSILLQRAVKSQLKCIMYTIQYLVRLHSPTPEQWASKFQRERLSGCKRFSILGSWGASTPNYEWCWKSVSTLWRYGRFSLQSM